MQFFADLDFADGVSALGHLQTWPRPAWVRSALTSGHWRPQLAALGHVWTAPGWQEESSRCSIGRSSHVFGLLARFT
jgi:hypothetical protein